ncbi:hypothetical protein H0E87_020177, partial [Populus deltoides]
IFPQQLFTSPPADFRPSKPVIPRMMSQSPHTQQRRGNTLHLLHPAEPTDPIASSGSPNTAAPRDQQPPFLLAP